MNDDAVRQSASARNIGFALAAAAAAGTALFLWRRKDQAIAQESTADEVEAHPS